MTNKKVFHAVIVGGYRRAHELLREKPWLNDLSTNSVENERNEEESNENGADHSDGDDVNDALQHAFDNANSDTTEDSEDEKKYFIVTRSNIFS